MKLKPNITDFKNIALIQTAFLGDTVLALYLAQSIKNLAPESRLIFVSTPAAATIVSSAKSIDKVITYDKRNSEKGWSGVKRFADKLKAENIDCIIAPHRSLRTSLLAFYSKGKYTAGFDISAASFLYNYRAKYYNNLHETERNKLLLSAFSEYSNNLSVPEVDIAISREDIAYVSDLFQEKGFVRSSSIIAIAPGSVWETKRWLSKHFASLACGLAHFGYLCVFIGGSEDTELCEEIAKESSTVSLAGRLSLPQTTYLLSQSKALITNDSAPTHLAGLVKCPTITIYGATSHIFGFAPRGEKDIAIEALGLKCHPCAIHGGKKCPLGTLDCIKSISPDYVLGKCLDILK